MKLFFLNVSLLLFCILGTSQCYGQMDFGPDPLVSMTEAPMDHTGFYSPASTAAHHSTSLSFGMNKSGLLFKEES